MSAEGRTVAWGALTHGLLLASYYCVRPLRDQLGSVHGSRDLPWLFLATLVTMALVHPLWSHLASRVSRERLLPTVDLAFGGMLLLFVAASRSLGDEAWLGHVFFVWTSVFNLFVLSTFWSLAADAFSRERARARFSWLAMGGSLGAMAGSAGSVQLAERMGSTTLAAVAAVGLGVAALTTRRTLRTLPPRSTPAAPAGGGALAGLRGVVRSPYLLAVMAWMGLYTVSSTVVYFAQADILAGALPDPDARTAMFARIDLWVNGATLLIQAIGTPWLLQRLGIGRTLLLLPLGTGIGLLALGTWPVVAVLVAVQVLRRATAYAVARPAREALYTVLEPDEVYQAKHLLDTVVYRGGDQLGAWSMAGLRWAGLSLAATATAFLPLAAGWVWLSWWLGRRCEQMPVSPGAPRPDDRGAAGSPAPDRSRPHSP